VDKLIERLKGSLAEQLQERARLAAGNHQPIEAIEVFGIANEHNVCAELLESTAVCIEITL